MSKDAVDGFVECKEGLELGNPNCIKYKHYFGGEHGRI
jgi:hypothetical protein